MTVRPSDGRINRLNHDGILAKDRRLTIAESHSPVTNLFSKDAVLFDEVFDDVVLVLAHPTRDRNDQK
jgi:hypothetical protein